VAEFKAKLAISNIAWSPEEEDDEISVILSKLLISGIEVGPTKLWDNPTDQDDYSIKSCLDYWSAKGIKIMAMQALLFGHPECTIFDNESSRTKTLAYLSDIITLGTKLGVKIFVFGSPKNRLVQGLESKKVKDIAIKFFYTLGELAHKHSAKFCIEPNAAAYGCDFVCNTNDGIDIVKEVAHPGFRLHLDSGVMSLNHESYEESLDQAFEFMEHFHISEPYLQEIGKGDTDHIRIARHLRKMHYDKWVSIEMKNNLGESNVSTVKDSLEYVIEKYKSGIW